MSPALLESPLTTRADVDALEAMWAAPAYEPRRNTAPLLADEARGARFDVADAFTITLFAGLVLGGVVLAAIGIFG